MDEVVTIFSIMELIKALKRTMVDLWIFSCLPAKEITGGRLRAFVNDSTREMKGIVTFS